MTETMLQQAVDKLRQRAEAAGEIGGKVLLELGAQGILIDGRQTPLQINAADPTEKADCNVRMSLELLNDILDGRRKPFMAFVTGQIGINGDMSVAVKLQPLLKAG